jgi:hypothetical protein
MMISLPKKNDLMGLFCEYERLFEVHRFALLYGDYEILVLMIHKVINRVGLLWALIMYSKKSEE